MIRFPLDSTDLADVGSCQAHQGGEPVCDVQQSLGHSSPTLQQRAVDEGHATDPALPVRSLESPQQGVQVFPPRWTLMSHTEQQIHAKGHDEALFFYLATSQGPVAAPGERLSPVVGGVDDDAVAVVSVLPQGVGDVVHCLVHRGHHGGQLPPGNVGHVPVRVDVGLWRLQWRVNRLQGNNDIAEPCVYYFSSTRVNAI